MVLRIQYTTVMCCPVLVEGDWRVDEMTTIMEYIWDRLRKNPRGYLVKVHPGGNLKPRDFPKENPKANPRAQPRVASEGSKVTNRIN